MLDILGKLKVIFKENKRIMIIICATTLIASICAGTTVALLTAVSGPVENVFTIGNIDLELAETTGNSYKMIPGHSIKKDPTVTVKTGSEDCWLFIKIDKTEGFDNYFSYQLEDGWIWDYSIRKIKNRRKNLKSFLSRNWRDPCLLTRRKKRKKKPKKKRALPEKENSES